MKKLPRKPAVRQRPRTYTFEMEFLSLPKNIVRVERFLLRMNRTIRLDDGTMYRLQVATTEAVNNAILHGNGSDPTKRVCVVCKANRSCLTVRIRDEGRGFDPATLPNPLDERNLLKEHGRGVFLMRSLMDKVSFRRLKGGSVVTMNICYNR